MRLTIPHAAGGQGVRWQSIVLVCAGFAVGMLAHQMARPGLAMIATCVSIAALGAVVTMALIARRQREKSSRKRLERAMSQLQARLERHCQRVPRPHVRRPFGSHRADRQYVTVVGRNGSYLR